MERERDVLLLKDYVEECYAVCPLSNIYEISLAPWCDVCGGSSSLLTTELVANYVTILSHDLHGFIFLLYFYDYYWTAEER